jgi:hypothetical protein
VPITTTSSTAKKSPPYQQVRRGDQAITKHGLGGWDVPGARTEKNFMRANELRLPTAGWARFIQQLAYLHPPAYAPYPVRTGMIYGGTIAIAYRASAKQMNPSLC